MQKRARLIGEDIDLLAALARGADHAQGSAVTGGGQRAGIAVREHRLVVRHQRRAVASDGAVDGDIFLAYQLRFLNQPLADLAEWLAAKRGVQALHTVDRPKKIDRRRPRLREGLADRVDLHVQIRFARVLHADGDSHGGGHPDRRCAADNHVADGGGDLLVIAAGHVFFMQSIRLSLPCVGLHPDYHWSGRGFGSDGGLRPHLITAPGAWP